MGAFIGDAARVMLSGHRRRPRSVRFGQTIPEILFMAYQMTFAVITCALVGGSVAERMKFSAFILFCAIWLFVVYVPSAHWVWGGGFLQKMGLLDFAGGTVVHINAGVAGLVCALVLGNRVGFGRENLSPFDLSLAVIGTGLLWVGWFGFNGGSALGANSRAVFAIVATHLAACSGALVWSGLEWFERGKPSVLGVVSGAVAGLGTITPASGYVLPWHGVVIGVIAGGVCYWFCTVAKHQFRYDDSLDVFGVHGVGGIMGTLLAGVFATRAITASECEPRRRWPAGGRPPSTRGAGHRRARHGRLVRHRHADHAENRFAVHETARLRRRRARGARHRAAWRGAASMRNGPSSRTGSGIEPARFAAFGQSCVEARRRPRESPACARCDWWPKICRLGPRERLR